jgi:hypothetical protein
MYRDPLDELAETLRNLIGEVDKLAADPVGYSLVDEFGGSEKLAEGWADDVRAVTNVAAELLDRAHLCPPEEDWPAVREKLLDELDGSFGEMRESFELLHAALADPTMPPLDDLASDLRSADTQLYWLRRRNRGDKGSG